MIRMPAKLCLARGILAILLSLAVHTTLAAGQDAGVQLLEVEINGQPQDRIVSAIGENDTLALLADDARELRLNIAGVRTVYSDNAEFVVLAGVPGLKATVDAARQVLVLAAAPEAFTETRIGGQTSTHPRIATSETAGFVNYDLLGEADSGTGARTFGGTIETGTSGAFGLVDNTMDVAASGHAVTRLDTSYTGDLPDSMNRFTAGDTVSRTSATGAPLRFAGLQFGRDFSLQPGFITFPTATMQGTANLPSTVQVFVNNALRYQNDVPPGPFSIDQIPTVNGAGDTTVVVRDPLGRETVTQGSFYTTPALLSEGLWDYSSAVGLQRQNYGEQSFNYRTPFTSNLVRYGITGGLTGEVELDGSGPAQVEAGDVSFIVPGIGQAQLGGAASEGVSKANGTLLYAGISRIGANLSFSADIRHSIGGFTQFGDDAGVDKRLSQLNLSTGLSFGAEGSVSLGFTELQRAEMPLTSVTTLTYGVQVAEAGYLTLVVSSIDQAHRSTTTSLTFTMPLGGSSIASASVEDRGGALTSEQNYSYQPANQRGFGGSLTAGEGRFAVDDARLTFDSNEGSELAEVSHTATGTGARLGASGGFAFIGDDAYAARKLDDSFALVSVKDYPDVRVYRDNMEVARTDSDGDALISGLQPYQVNRLALDIGDIPIGTNLTGDTLEIVPAYRGGVLASFDVQATPGVMVVMKLPDGSFVPAGATIAAEGMTQPAFTGFDGETFLIGVTSGATIRAVWEGHRCAAKFDPVMAEGAPAPLICTEETAP